MLCSSLSSCLAASHHFFGLLADSHNPFTMNTYRCVSKQRLLSPLYSALTQNRGEGVSSVFPTKTPPEPSLVTDHSSPVTASFRPSLTLPLRNGMMVRFAYSRCAVPDLVGTGRRCHSGPGIRNRPSQRRAVCPHPSLATDGASEVASDIASKYRIGMAPRLPAARGSREGCS